MRIGVTLALVGAAITALGLTGSAVPASQATTPQATTPVKVTVTMTDFKFRLTKKTVPKNRRVSFTVLNKGKVGHDFDIPGVKNMPVIAAGKKFTNYTVTFKRAGRFRFVCTVPLHAGNGMTGNLTVK